MRARVDPGDRLWTFFLFAAASLHVGHCASCVVAVANCSKVHGIPLHRRGARVGNKLPVPDHQGSRNKLSLPGE